MLEVPLLLLTLHFLGDFVLQNNWMALNKSRSFRALLIHCWVYSLCFLFYGLQFQAVTLLLHLVVDFWTSRLTSRLWFMELGEELSDPGWWSVHVNMRKRHWFFVAVGADQLLHFACLALTYHLLLKGILT